MIGKTNPERVITYKITIPTPRSEVWRAWTTVDGARTFFSPDCKIDLKPGGAYEMYFNLSAPAGDKGGEGMILLAIHPEKMLSFTWNAPPDLPSVRGQMTHVTISLDEIDPANTLVTLKHDGWGEGGEWDLAYEYFTRAWGEVVLPRLKYRFEQGPVDWDNPKLSDFENFVELMKSYGDDKVYVHCQLNWRASSFVYLYRITQLGVSIEEALQDLTAIWQPKDGWQEYIDATLAAYQS